MITSSTETHGLKQKLGVHLVAELYLDDPGVLNDEEKIKESLIDAAIAGNMTVINASSHKFSPHGVTALILLAESHISIHTWPEYGYAAVDVFACGCGDAEASLKRLEKILPVKKIKVLKIERGLF